MKTKKMTLKEKQAVPLDSELKKRIIDVKDRLPKSGLTSILVFKHPELDTVKKRALISNVLQLRTTDEDLTIKLEAIAESLQSLNQLYNEK